MHSKIKKLSKLNGQIRQIPVETASNFTKKSDQEQDVYRTVEVPTLFNI